MGLQIFHIAFAQGQEFFVGHNDFHPDFHILCGEVNHFVNIEYTFL